jgi:dihydropteroate synthase
MKLYNQRYQHLTDSPIVNIRGVLIGPNESVKVMSVINLSPESFYKVAIAESIERFQEMMRKASESGADIIDVGGASTAPKQVYGTSEISVADEIERVTQMLESIVVSDYPPISIDTTSSKVAEIALGLGAAMVNDISGLRADSKMASIVAEHEVPIVLMANCNPPCGSVKSSIKSLEDSLRIAKETGIRPDRIILDPGIGFGKPPELDIEILSGLTQYTKLKHPLLVGVSRKAFIGHILDQPNPDDRLVGSLIATAFAVIHGACVIRTHDVAETKAAIKMGEAMRDKRRSDRRDGVEIEMG